jgi:hypothetical protein
MTLNRRQHSSTPFHRCREFGDGAVAQIVSFVAFESVTKNEPIFMRHSWLWVAFLSAGGFWRSIVNVVDAVPEDSGLDIEILDQHQVDG